MKKVIKHINSVMDVLGKAMIFVILIILLAQFLAIIIYGFRPLMAKAEEPAHSAPKPENIPVLSVPVGNFTGSTFDKNYAENWIGQYIKAWYDYTVGAIGIVAVVMVMWGGIIWITAGGNAGQVDEAKGKIKNAIIGIVLLLGSYTILHVINPKLLTLTMPTINGITEPPKICCKDKNGKYDFTFNKECDKSKGYEPADFLQCNAGKGICESGNPTPCGQKDEKTLCIGFKTNKYEICPLSKDANQVWSGGPPIIATDTVLGIREVYISKIHESKRCKTNVYETCEIKFEDEGISSCSIGSVCEDKGKICVAELKNGVIQTLLCR